MLCRILMSDFVHEEMWAPNSPDVNPLDYAFLGIMKTECTQLTRQISLLNEFENCEQIYLKKSSTPQLTGGVSV
jgi:hypothetical protein